MVVLFVEESKMNAAFYITTLCYICYGLFFEKWNNHLLVYVLFDDYTCKSRVSSDRALSL